MTRLSDYILPNVDEESERVHLRDMCFTDPGVNFRLQSDLFIHNRERNEN